MSERFNQFRTKYIEELTKFREENKGSFGINWNKTAEEIVDMMIASINKSGARNDWLKYNQCMKAAAHFVGIKKSPELREFIKASLQGNS